MCWDATTSFVTLGIGSLFNIIAYILLRKRSSKTASVVWAWQYALLMQIPEGIAWVQLNNGETDIHHASRLALFLNVTQPIVLFIAIRYGEMHVQFRYAHVALVMYVTLLLADVEEVWEDSRSIAPTEGCTHLNLGFWNFSRATLYVVASLFVLSEVVKRYWMVVNGLIFLLSLLLALFLYPCGVGSVWCFLIAGSGCILLVADVMKPYIWQRLPSRLPSHILPPRLPSHILPPRLPQLQPRLPPRRLQPSRMRTRVSNG